MTAEWMPTIVSVAGMFITGGGVAWYVKDLGQKIANLSAVISDLPKEYVLKTDCLKDHDWIDTQLKDHGKEIEEAHKRISYLQGTHNGIGN